MVRRNLNDFLSFVTVAREGSFTRAALEGLGVAFLPEEEFAPHIEVGRLVRVLEDRCPAFSGYYLYYPSRRQPSPAFSLVAHALRVTGPRGVETPIELAG